MFLYWKNLLVLFRRQLRTAEDHVRNRSRAAEGRWSCDKWQQSSAGRTTSKVSLLQVKIYSVFTDKLECSCHRDIIFSTCYKKGKLILLFLWSDT
jgi:mediator of RNA polymerase II transcription subunit 12